MGNALDRCIHIVECLFIDARRDFGADADPSLKVKAPEEPAKPRPSAGVKLRREIAPRREPQEYLFDPLSFRDVAIVPKIGPMVFRDDGNEIPFEHPSIEELAYGGMSASA